MTCIFVNMIIMCLETADQSKEMEAFLYIVNGIFTLIYTVESLMKLIALNWKYFSINWNIFDMTILVLSLIGI